MELGHNQGRYRIDRNGEACDLMSDLIAELGIDGYGRLDDNPENHFPGSLMTIGLVETPRGVNVYNPQTGEPLLISRAYWWDDPDDSEFDKPNLEIPSIGVGIRWYKYWSRDAYSTQPLTVELVNRIRKLMRPALEAIAPYVEHPRRLKIEWSENRETTPIFEEDEDTICACWIIEKCSTPVTWTHGYVTLCDNPETPYEARMETEDELGLNSAQFSSLDEAKAWCERRACTWERHSGMKHGAGSEAPQPYEGVAVIAPPASGKSMKPEPGYGYENPPEDFQYLGEWCKAWRDPQTGEWTISQLFDGLETSQITLYADEAKAFARLVGQGESTTFATSAENEAAVNAYAGAGGEQARIHAAEALHRAGRL